MLYFAQEKGYCLISCDLAMEAVLNTPVAQNRSEFNSDFHKAKWKCFKLALGTKEAMAKKLFMFGVASDKNLGWINAIQILKMLKSNSIGWIEFQ